MANGSSSSSWRVLSSRGLTAEEEEGGGGGIEEEEGEAVVDMKGGGMKVCVYLAKTNPRRRP